MMTAVARQSTYQHIKTAQCGGHWHQTAATWSISQTAEQLQAANGSADCACESHVIHPHTQHRDARFLLLMQQRASR